MKNNNTNKGCVSWAKFKWISEEINGKHFDKTAMFIPCRVDGITNVLTFQFDLGSDLTGVYEKNFNSFYRQNKSLEDKIKNVKFRSKKYFENLTIKFGDYTANSKSSYVFANYGEYVENFNLTDTIHIGTIGADLFKNKILIIDYPNERFAINDNMPKEFENIPLTDITFDKRNRPLLPMTIKNKTYQILFDNGSSMFPLITEVENINNFSTEPFIDTIEVSSFGKIHNMTGKQIKETFTLGGQTFNSTMIYADYRKNKGDRDAIAGNALFWNKTILIDFKNKKFGVK